MIKEYLASKAKSALMAIRSAKARLLFASSLLCSSLPSYSGEYSDEFGFSFFKDFNLEAKVEAPPVLKVEHIPLEVRAMDVHPWDVNTLGHIAKPIEEDNVVLPSRTPMVDFRAGAQGFLGRIVPRLGAGTELVATGGDRHEEVYDDSFFSPKKTFYDVQPSFSFHIPILRPYLFSEVKTRVTEKFSFDLGYKVSQETLTLKNGWARYTDSSGNYRSITNEKWDLITMNLGTTYASFQWFNEPESGYYIPWCLALDIGATRPINKNVTDMGKRVDFKFIDPAFLVGIKIVFLPD